MKTRGIISAVLAAGTLFSLTGCGDTTKQLEAENAALRAELAELKVRAAEEETARATQGRRAQSDAEDTARLRGEVTRLRTAATEAEKLRAENQQLRNENQQLRSASATAAAPPPAAPAAPTTGSFPRESWSFAGYTSPEAALVSAIWSMQQGNPKQYFESLTQEEQLRMAKAWEGKSQEEIVAKHQSDTSKITGLRVISTTPIADDHVLMSVHIEGVNRVEQVAMKRVGNDWKFGGFMRDPKAQ